MFAGIDIGSVTSKAVLLNNEGKVISSSLIRTTYNQAESGRDAFQTAFKKARKASTKVLYTVATGYGRNTLSFADLSLTEILCHAEGTKAIFPEIRTIIDIGGQDSKVIELDELGRISKFEMNDKCAAGTGRFLEVLAERILALSVEELGQLSLKSNAPCTLSSVCTVFAESEIISYLSQNKSREDIASGLHKAIAKRVLAIGYSANINYISPICFSGGVARNLGVVKAINEELGKEVIVPPEPQLTAALGAALFAKQYASKKQF